MKVQDITPQYVKSVRALGFSRTRNELIAMKVQDITPEYVKADARAWDQIPIARTISSR